MTDELRLELEAGDDDVVEHLDRSIPPATPPPDVRPSGRTRKAAALLAWIEASESSAAVMVEAEDTDALIEIGGEVSYTDGCTGIHLWRGGRILAVCYLWTQHCDRQAPAPTTTAENSIDVPF